MTIIDLTLSKLVERDGTIIARLRDGTEVQLYPSSRKGIQVCSMPGSASAEDFVDPRTVDGMSLTGTHGTLTFAAPATQADEYAVDLENRTDGDLTIAVSGGSATFVIPKYGGNECTPEHWRDEDVGGKTTYVEYRTRAWIRIAGAYRVPGFTDTTSG